MCFGVVYRFGSFSVCFLPDFLFLFPLPLYWLSVAVLFAFLLAFVLVLFGSSVRFCLFLPLCFSCCIILPFLLYSVGVFCFLLCVSSGFPCVLSFTFWFSFSWVFSLPRCWISLFFGGVLSLF